eukprot:COSAG01_NODE_1369_length_10552_cov_5.204535_4_plen_176_part_00
MSALQNGHLPLPDAEPLFAFVSRHCTLRPHPGARQELLTQPQKTPEPQADNDGLHSSFPHQNVCPHGNNMVGVLGDTMSSMHIGQVCDASSPERYLLPVPPLPLSCVWVGACQKTLGGVGSLQLGRPACTGQQSAPCGGGGAGAVVVAPFDTLDSLLALRRAHPLQLLGFLFLRT